MIHIPYHVHSVYSVLDSCLELGSYVEWGKEHNLPALFLTDHGTLSGCYQFWKMCSAFDIKPVVGIEFYVGDVDKKLPNHHLVVVAKSVDGYRKLIELNNRAVKNNHHYKPRIKNSWLLDEKIDDIAISTACVQNEIARSIVKRSESEAKDLIERYHRVYGDDFYLELQFNELKQQHTVNEYYCDMAKKNGIRTIIGSDVHYATKEDYEIQSVMHKIRNKSTDETKKDNDFKCKELYLKTFPELFQSIHRFKYKIDRETFINSVKAIEELASSCDIEFDTSFKYPAVSFTESPHDYFLNECKKGLLTKYRDKQLNSDRHSEYVACMMKEYEALKREKYITMFVIVHDLIKKCREHDIWVGPGRGSVVGVFCSYLMGITALNPFDYDLLFERFCPLTTGARVTPPDIDVDFEDRDKAIQIVRETYGEGNVLTVGNFTYYKPRSTIIDLLRVKGLKTDEYFRYSKVYDVKQTFEENFNSIILKEFKKKHSSEYRMLTRLMAKIRQLGKHTAAVIVLPDAEMLPIAKNKGSYITQYDGKMLEDHGYAKLDCLGLDTLAIIKHAVRSAGIRFDFNNVSLDDPAVYEEFDKGNTVGIFQFESPHTVEILKKIKVTCFDDIMAVCALIRPGLDVESFIRNSNHPENITYLPGTENVYQSTKGVLLYQEQVMRFCTDVAGFTLYEADKVRKIIAKKTGDLLSKKAQFIAGATEKLQSAEVAEKLWDSIEQCGSYIFNKSHACAYTYLSYICMWLKIYHPVHFLSACMKQKKPQARKFVMEAKALGIKLIYPDVNVSKAETEVYGSGIAIGLSSIKGIEVIGYDIVENAPYESVCDFVARSKASKDVVEILAQIGAFKSLEPNNAMAYREVVEYFIQKKKKKFDPTKKQLDMFGTAPETLADFSDEVNLTCQIEYLGHTEITTVFEKNFDVLSQAGLIRIGDYEKGRGCVAGIVSHVDSNRTKKGDEYKVVELYDYYDKINVVCWPEDVEQYDKLFQIGKKLVMKVESNSDYKRPSLINADERKVYEFEVFLEKLGKK